jgi:hypothetical protein
VSRTLQFPFARRRRPERAALEEWPERTGRPRVLIENPDQAELWAAAGILREAGYDVAVCAGPTVPGESPRGEKPVACPLVFGGYCGMVEEADVVVAATTLPDSRGILAAHARRQTPALVVEGPEHVLQRDRDVIPDAIVIEEPVTAEQLVAAVGEALDR